MKRIVFIILGSFFLLLGLIGLMIPVLPQIPFLAAGFLFLARGSHRVKKRIFSSKFYEKHLKEHVENSKVLKKIVYKMVGDLNDISDEN